MGILAMATILVTTAQSPIKSDEVVTFFPTYGHLRPDGAGWAVRIHGWIYEPETNDSLRQSLLSRLGESLGLNPGEPNTRIFRQRAQAFVMDNERNKEISIDLGRTRHKLPASGANGHFQTTVSLGLPEATELLQTATSTDGWVTFQAITRPEDKRNFSGRVQLIGQTGLSVISDIDDTIKISDVRNRRSLVANTFLREFEAVPGMANVYQRWAKQGAAFHYVSASPWQLYAPISDFLTKDGFPAGSFHMKLFRWKDESFFNLFSSQEEYKRQVIVPILKAFPRRKFILVGDSGEKDPEIYGALARDYPQQVARVFIRNATDEGPEAARYKDAFKGLPNERWQIFRDPKEIGPIEKLSD